MTFAGEFFFEEIESLRVAIMLFKLKSILYPPDVTAINTDLAPFWLLHVNIYLFPIIFQGLWVFGREPRSKRTCYLNVLLLTAKTIYIFGVYKVEKNWLNSWLTRGSLMTRDWLGLADGSCNATTNFRVTLARRYNPPTLVTLAALKTRRRKKRKYTLAKGLPWHSHISSYFQLQRRIYKGSP